MAHLKYGYGTLKAFCDETFEKLGFSVEDSAFITDVLLTSDKYGIESHGMQRMDRYYKGIKKGMIRADARPETVFETPVSAVIDGHDGMGQLNARFAMNTAIEKAKKTGIAIVNVKNSNHYGIAGYYAKMACDQGMIGMSCTNSEAIMVPTYGRKAMLGSNPIAVSMPADPYPFFFDASTTVVTRGKLEMYRKAEKQLPEGWALGSGGRPSNNADTVLKNIVDKKGGGIVPLGGSEEITGSHKGYGYGMLCEIFSSILSQGLTSNHSHMNGKGGTCHGFMAIDPTIFGDPKEIGKHFSDFLEELRESPKADGQSRIYTHGEKEALAVERSEREGIAVDMKTLLELKQISECLKVDFAGYFGDVELDAGNYESIY